MAAAPHEPYREPGVNSQPHSTAAQSRQTRRLAVCGWAGMPASSKAAPDAALGAESVSAQAANTVGAGRGRGVGTATAAARRRTCDEVRGDGNKSGPSMSGSTSAPSEFDEVFPVVGAQGQLLASAGSAFCGTSPGAASCRDGSHALCARRPSAPPLAACSHNELGALVGVLRYDPSRAT